jgi:hypothetical protein
VDNFQEDDRRSATVSFRFDPQILRKRHLKVAEVLNVGKAVHAAKHVTDGHEEHLAEMMHLVAAGARVFDDGE